MKKFRDITTAGQVTPNDYNELAEALEGMRFFANYPITVSQDAGGVVIGYDQEPDFYAVLQDPTPSSSISGCVGFAYTYHEVLPDGRGGWSLLPDGRSGSATVSPAYEQNGNCLSAGTVVLLRQGCCGEYLFSQCCNGFVVVAGVPCYCGCAGCPGGTALQWNIIVPGGSSLDPGTFAVTNPGQGSCTWVAGDTVTNDCCDTTDSPLTCTIAQPGGCMDGLTFPLTFNGTNWTATISVCEGSVDVFLDCSGGEWSMVLEGHDCNVGPFCLAGATLVSDSLDCTEGGFKAVFVGAGTTASPYFTSPFTLTISDPPQDGGEWELEYTGSVWQLSWDSGAVVYECSEDFDCTDSNTFDTLITNTTGSSVPDEILVQPDAITTCVCAGGSSSSTSSGSTSCPGVVGTDGCCYNALPANFYLQLTGDGSCSCITGLHTLAYNYSTQQWEGTYGGCGGTFAVIVTCIAAAWYFEITWSDGVNSGSYTIGPDTSSCNPFELTGNMNMADWSGTGPCPSGAVAWSVYPNCDVPSSSSSTSYVCCGINGCVQVTMVPVECGGSFGQWILSPTGTDSWYASGLSFMGGTLSIELFCGGPGRYTAQLDWNGQLASFNLYGCTTCLVCADEITPSDWIGGRGPCPDDPSYIIFEVVGGTAVPITCPSSSSSSTSALGCCNSTSCLSMTVSGCSCVNGTYFVANNGPDQWGDEIVDTCTGGFFAYSITCEDGAYQFGVEWDTVGAGAGLATVPMVVSSCSPLSLTAIILPGQWDWIGGTNPCGSNTIVITCTHAACPSSSSSLISSSSSSSSSHVSSSSSSSSSSHVSSSSSSSSLVSSSSSSSSSSHVSSSSSSSSSCALIGYCGCACLPTTLHCTITNGAGCACMNGSVLTFTYNSGGNNWITSLNTLCGQTVGGQLTCTGGTTWQLLLSGGTCSFNSGSAFNLTTASCSPIHLTGGCTVSGCCSGGITVSITT